MAEKPAPAPAAKKAPKQAGVGPKPMTGLIGLGLFVAGVLWLVYDVINRKPKKKPKGRGH